MARQIIIVNNELDSSSKQIKGTVVFWLTVPANLVPYAPNPNAASVVPDASVPELAALQSGTIREMVFQGQMTTQATVAQIEQALLASYTQAQTTLNNQSPPKRFTGGVYDPASGWTNMPA